MSRALVIGSRGFLGRRLVVALHERGVTVQGVSRSPSASEDIPTCRPDELPALADDFDCVYLLAAVIPYGAMDRVTPALIASNISLPQQVVERFPSSRLVFASSVAVYGEPMTAPIGEEHPFCRPSAYGLSKALGERIVAAHENAVSLRFSSLYGVGMTAATFVPMLIRRGREEGQLVVFGDGSRRQDYLHVEDAVRMLMAAGESNRTGLFNAVQGTSATNLEVAQLVSEQLGGIPIEFDGSDDSPSFEYSRVRWDDAFACRPQITINEGIGRMMKATA